MNSYFTVLIVLSSAFAVVQPASRFVLKGRRVIKLSEDAATCPSTYEAVGEGCYFVSNTTSSSWYQAVKQCANMNGYLATISTEEENTALKQYLATLTYDSVSGWWVGGSDEAQEGEWRWKSNLQKMCFTDWCPGEPNNYGHENCLALNPECDLQWNDRACNYGHFGYICEPYPF